MVCFLEVGSKGKCCTRGKSSSFEEKRCTGLSARKRQASGDDRGIQRQHDLGASWYMKRKKESCRKADCCNQ